MAVDGVEPGHIESLWRDRSRIESVQSQRLTEMVQAIVPRNRFWSRKFQESGVDLRAIQGREDLSLLPLTTKQELVENQAWLVPYGSNLSYPSSHYRRLHQTSGTSGRPLRWMDTQQSWDWFLECWRQIFLLAGVTTNDRFFFPFSFGPFIGFWAAFEGAQKFGAFCLAGGGMSTSVRLQALVENDVTVVCCTPTYALRLAEQASQEGVDLRESSVRMLIVAGEPGGCVPGTRTKLEHAWDARVIDHWGMTEIGSLGAEAEDRPGGLYILETECIAEILDPETQAPVAAGGTGELVVTNLGRWGSPLFRYRTGDIVRSAAGDDPTGRALLWLEGGILGRTDDMLIVRGNNVFPSSIESILREIPEVAEFRIEVRQVRAMPELTVVVEPAASAVDRAGLSSRVQTLLQQRLGFAVNTRLTESPLERFELKSRRVVHRD